MLSMGHLLPEAINLMASTTEGEGGGMQALVYSLAGFMVMLFIEKVAFDVDHGHGDEDDEEIDLSGLLPERVKSSANAAAATVCRTHNEEANPQGADSVKSVSSAVTTGGVRSRSSSKATPLSWMNSSVVLCFAMSIHSFLEVSDYTSTDGGREVHLNSFSWSVIPFSIPNFHGLFLHTLVLSCPVDVLYSLLYFKTGCSPGLGHRLHICRDDDDLHRPAPARRIHGPASLLPEVRHVQALHHDVAGWFQLRRPGGSLHRAARECAGKHAGRGGGDGRDCGNLHLCGCNGGELRRNNLPPHPPPHHPLPPLRAPPQLTFTIRSITFPLF